MYIAISVGNTDNKLTQQEWSDFVLDIRDAIEQKGVRIHFFGGAPNWERWQNVAWIVELTGTVLEFASDITNVRDKYGQESAFILYGEGRFV